MSDSSRQSESWFIREVPVWTRALESNCRKQIRAALAASPHSLSPRRNLPARKLRPVRRPQILELLSSQVSGKQFVRLYSQHPRDHQQFQVRNTPLLILQSRHTISAHVPANVFQFFLDHLAETVPKAEGLRQRLVLDNASWHKATRLRWHHFEPVYLPGYSPDFNPIERLWLRLKADWFWDFIARTHTELSDRLCAALKSFINQPDKTASLCAIRK